MVYKIYSKETRACFEQEFYTRKQATKYLKDYLMKDGCFEIGLDFYKVIHVVVK